MYIKGKVNTGQYCGIIQLLIIYVHVYNKGKGKRAFKGKRYSYKSGFQLKKHNIPIKNIFYINVQANSQLPKLHLHYK